MGIKRDTQLAILGLNRGPEHSLFPPSSDISKKKKKTASTKDSKVITSCFETVKRKTKQHGGIFLQAFSAVGRINQPIFTLLYTTGAYLFLVFIHFGTCLDNTAAITTGLYFWGSLNSQSDRFLSAEFATESSAARYRAFRGGGLAEFMDVQRQMLFCLA